MPPDGAAMPARWLGSMQGAACPPPTQPVTCAAAVECVAEEVQQDGLAAGLHPAKRALHVRRHLWAGGERAPQVARLVLQGRGMLARLPASAKRAARRQRGRHGRRRGRGRPCRPGHAERSTRSAASVRSVERACGSRHSLGSSSSTSTTGFRMRGTWVYLFRVCVGELCWFSF